MEYGNSSNANNTVEVVIDGEVVTLVGVESEEYIQRVARYIDKKISEINRSRKQPFAANSFMKTLLISVNIADDLFKERENYKKLEETLKEQSETIGQYILDINRLEETNQLLTDDLLTEQQHTQKLAEASQTFDDQQELYSTEITRLEDINQKLTDECTVERENIKMLEEIIKEQAEKIEKYSSDFSLLGQENQLLAGKVTELETALGEMQTEFEEYIEAFDQKDKAKIYQFKK